MLHKEKSKMHSKEIALFLVAFCLAGGIINATGIFSPVENMDVGTENLNSSMSDDILEVNEDGVYSSSDISSEVDSWGLLLQTMDIIKQMLSVLVLPGPFLRSIGVPTAFADAVQVILNIVLAWGIIQFALNRSTKNLD
jgi:hypothetical protein